MKYLIRANHPVLKRIDETVNEMEVGQRVAELLCLYYEIESVKSAQQSAQRTKTPLAVFLAKVLWAFRR